MSSATQQVQEVINDDLLLITQVRDGNARAFETLYRRFKQPIYYFCVRMIEDSMVAEDIFQDVFIKCYEQIRQGAAITNIKSYLFTSARNRCLNTIRDRKHSYQLDEISDTLSGHEQEDFDVTENLQMALQKLPPMNREAFLLCEYEGYSYEEAAGLTDVPVSTVRKRIFRARQKLRQMLERRLEAR